MRITNIDILRGIAALSITFFHLTGNSNLSETLKESGKYGYLGVEIFFVISGYIIPFSMQKMNYKRKYFFKLLLKRVVRIHPPYLVMLIMTLLLIYVTNIPLPTYPSLLAHVFYLNDILSLEWISPIFWTLALEFQFYILIGLFYSLLIDKSTFFSSLFIVFILLSSFILPSSFLPHYFGFFALGIVLFRFQLGKTSILHFWMLNLTITLFILYNNGGLEGLIAILTVIFICYFPALKHSIVKSCLVWLGTISYSLYLIHWEVGRGFIAISRHIPIIAQQEGMRVLIGIIASLFFAWLFYMLIEFPSVKWSKKLKLN